MHEAADTNNSQVVSFLLSKTSVDLNFQTSTGNTAAHLAAKKGHVAAFSALCSDEMQCVKVSLKNKSKQTVADVVKKLDDPKTAQNMREILATLEADQSKLSSAMTSKSSKSGKRAKEAELQKLIPASKGVDVFLSYSWTNSQFVDEIYGRLSEKSFHVWQDKHKIGPGDRLYAKLQEGVQNCKVFVPCLSTEYVNSDNCKSEFHLAKLWKKPIVPVILEPKLTRAWPPVCELAPLLAPLVYLPVVSGNKIDSREIDKLCRKVSSYEVDHSQIS